MSDAQKATDDDLRQAIMALPDMTGYTYAELAAMAADDSFPGLLVRSAWYAVAGLGDLADEATSLRRRDDER